MVKHDNNPIFMPNGQMAGLIWSYHFPGTDLYFFSATARYIQTSKYEIRNRFIHPKYQNVFDNNVLVHTETGNLLCEKLDLRFDSTFDYFHLTLPAERWKNCRSHKLTGFLSSPIFWHIFTKTTRFGLCCCWESLHANKSSVFL